MNHVVTQISLYDYALLSCRTALHMVSGMCGDVAAVRELLTAKVAA